MFLNVVQLAESFGVDESVVEGWIRNEGLPNVPEGGRLLFDKAQVVAWAAERGLVARAGFLAPARPVMRACGRDLGGLLRAGGIWRGVTAAELLPALERIVAALPGAGSEVRRLLAQRVRLEGGVTWAPVGGGMALPHLRAPAALGRDAGLLSVLFLKDPLPLAEPQPDGVPVTRLLFFIAPSPRAHLEMLAQLSAGLTRGALRPLLESEAGDEAILAAVSAMAAEGGR